MHRISLRRGRIPCKLGKTLMKPRKRHYEDYQKAIALNLPFHKELRDSGIPARTTPPLGQIIKEGLQEMLEAQVVRSSSSPYSTPVMIVRKKDATYRFCIDYRANRPSARTLRRHRSRPAAHSRGEQAIIALTVRTHALSLEVPAGERLSSASPNTPDVPNTKEMSSPTLETESLHNRGAPQRRPEDEESMLKAVFQTPTRVTKHSVSNLPTHIRDTRLW